MKTSPSPLALPCLDYRYSLSLSFQVQQAATGPPKYSGPVDVAKTLFREGGIRSVYKGTVATLLRGRMRERLNAKDNNRQGVEALNRRDYAINFPPNAS